MPTLRRSSELLAGAIHVDDLAEITRELGFSPPLPLDAAARSALGLPASIRNSTVARGPGALRALLLELRSAAAPREILAAVAASLARQTAQLLWIVLAADAERVAIICWSSAGTHPRIASLVCRRETVFTSDAETLCSLCASLSPSDLLTHSRYLDLLGRQSITRRFFRSLETVVANLAESVPHAIALSERRELALVYLSRLIFLSFLQTKGWLDGDFGFLENGYARCIEEEGNYQKRVLEPLFFGTLNTRVKSRAARARQFGRIPFLNGGLFARSTLEKRARRLAFSDEALGNAFGSLLSRYRFSGRENSAGWSDASIDPEILGKAFEALMASEDRKGSGAFYTPQELVVHVTDEALGSLHSHGRTLAALRELRIIDPACGSGAFLVYALERLAQLRREKGESGSIAEVRRRVLASSIFGVDVNPTAIWLCELRLWLSVVVESAELDPMRVVPLPNLDRHIRVGDSLAGGGLGGKAGVSGMNLQALRNRYVRATGPRKLTLARALDRTERDAAVTAIARSVARLTGERKELLLQLRSRDLFGERPSPTKSERERLLDLRRQMRAKATRARTLRAGGALPFSFEAHFSDAAAAGGFDIVIGNPPWVRLHRIAPASRRSLRGEFTVYREAAWRVGAALAGAGRGFAAQVDMAALFAERSTDLLRDGGIMALLLPAKLWRSLAGGGVRNLLAARTHLLTLEDHAEARSGFDAAVYPSLLVARTRSCGPDGTPAPAAPVSKTRCEVHTRERMVSWESQCGDLALDDTPGSPWLMIPPEVRRAFDRIRERGTPLAHSGFGRPLLGVKTGFNDAYIIHIESTSGAVATIRTRERHSTIEKELLRPVVRGESLSGSDPREDGEHIIWPHDPRGRPLEALPPLARRWFLYHRRRLSQRTDLHDNREWWSLFRIESGYSDKARVIWSDIGKRPRAIAIDAGDDLVPLNTCYAVQCRTLHDARALAALFNSPLAAAWLDVIAEQARGGYRRYLGWTMALLPLPTHWPSARVALAASTGAREIPPSDDDLLDAALIAYGLGREEVEPLLQWTGHSK